MKFEDYPGQKVPVMEEQEQQEDHLMEMINIRNKLYEDLGNASDKDIPRNARADELMIRMNERIKDGEKSAGIEGGRKALYFFYDVIYAQYQRDVFMSRSQNRKTSFRNLPWEQKQILFQLVKWQQDFAEFFAAHAGFAIDAKIHNELNEAIDDMIADAPLFIEEFQGEKLSKDQIEKIVHPLLQGAKSAAAGINLLRQITDGWNFKWGEKRDDIQRKIDAIAYREGIPICTLQFKGIANGNTRIQHALEYRKSVVDTEGKDEAGEFIMGTKQVFPGAVPIYVVVGFNEQNMDRDTAIIHHQKYRFLESQLHQSLGK